MPAPRNLGAALEALAPFHETGTVFVVHAPTHSAPVVDVARTLIDAQAHAYRRHAGVFFGCVDKSTRDALHARGIPVHTTPARLARAFARLVDYRHGRELLMQTPDGLPAQVPAAVDAAQALVRAALAGGVAELDGERASRVLGYFGIVVKPGPARVRRFGRSQRSRHRGSRRSTPESPCVRARFRVHVFGGRRARGTSLRCRP